MMKSNKNIIVIFLIIFWFVLDYAYTHSITNFFAYDGFEYYYSKQSFVVFVIFFLLTIVFLKKANTVFLYQISVVSIMLIYIPNGILYYAFHHNLWILLSSFLWVILPLILSRRHLHKRIFKEISYDDLPKVLLVISIILTIPFIFTFGIPSSLNSFLLQDIYDVRVEAVAKSNIFTDYISSPLAKVLIPTTIVLSIMKKKWIILLLSILLQLYMFLVNPHKSVLAFLIIALFFSLFEKPFAQLKYFVLCMGCIILLGTYLVIQYEFPFVESYMTRRSFFVPALLNHAYFDVFEYEKLYLSYSKINPFIDSKIDITPSHYVGLEYFGRDMGANTGLVGSGYMDFGMIGVLINIFIYSKIVSYLGNLNYNHKFFGLILIFVITFNSSALPTSLFTHGMLALILVLNELATKNKINEN